jgi:hypothetical protein
MSMAAFMSAIGAESPLAMVMRWAAGSLWEVSRPHDARAPQAWIADATLRFLSARRDRLGAVQGACRRLARAPADRRRRRAPR